MKKLKAIVRSAMPDRFYDWMAECKWLVRIQMRYRRAKRRMRAKIRRGEKIRVVFLDSEIAKWKCQSLYDAMKEQGRFEPVIGLLMRDHAEGKTAAEQTAQIEAARIFFEKNGCECIVLYDPASGRNLDLHVANPDIVFYQQPWLPAEYDPALVSCYALTCYVPYFVPSFGFPEMEAHMDFHRYLAYFFLLNKGWRTVYSEGVRHCFFSGKLVVSGHPMLDPFNEQQNQTRPEYVIYAPHFSVGDKCTVKISTFRENGVEILRYAQRHPEIKWIFKPHPVLRFALQKYMGYSESQVQEYYDAWGQIGQVCEKGNYIELFKNTKALITDCGSFLVEFGATGRPIIHLISSRNDYVPCPPTQKLFVSYYDVHNFDEMYRTFETVLEKGADPKGEERHAAVKKARLTGTHAAKNILEVLDRTLGIKLSNLYLASRRLWVN